MEQYILSIDAGTTSARCIIFDKQGNVRAMKQRELHMVYPHDGWVEQSAREIWEVQRTVCQEAIAALAIRPEQIAAIGITNQRETTIVWDKQTGEPIAPAIVWQCRRTASMAEDLRTRGLEPYIRKTTGLLVDAYFSATKISWILDHVAGARQRAKRGKLLFGTVDSWLIWNLTGGKRHVTDVTNAARTMLFDIHAHKWDAAICRELDIPMELLPEVVPSSGVLGETEAQLFGAPIPIAGVAGDQQSALFGQTCFEPGNAKNTYGTGCFLLMNTGDKPVGEPQRPADDGCLGNRRKDNICAGRVCVCRRCGNSVAARRNGSGQAVGGYPSAGTVGAGHGRGIFCAGVYRLGRAVLGPVCPRHAHRIDAQHQPRTGRACGAGIACLSNGGCAACDAAGRPVLPCKRCVRTAARAPTTF